MHMTKRSLAAIAVGVCGVLCGPAWAVEPKAMSLESAADGLSVAQPMDPLFAAAFADEVDVASDRKPFESDRSFPRFIGPISNPVLAKDPRSLTELQVLFVQNEIPDHHPLAGDFQVYGVQARVALTDRLTFIADKDGYIVLNPDGADEQDGWANIAAGLKYQLIRDVPNQFILAASVQYEMQSGESAVFQGHGDGIFDLVLTAGKEFAHDFHVIGNAGYRLPVDNTDNSQMFFASGHADVRLAEFLYPMFEVNWYHYTHGGDRGIPAIIGEGDGLLNIGTTGVAGNDLITLAGGLKAVVNDHVEVGAVYEIPVGDREDLIDYRVTAVLILRY